MTDDAISSQLSDLEKRFSDMRKDCEGGGSPGEWMVERMDELETERRRRLIDAELNDDDKATGDALAYFLGGLFIDVQDDQSYMHTKMTSVDAWQRVARVLRIHGLKIADR